MKTAELIKENQVYKLILTDSFGGVMYDVANRNKYQTDEILKLWQSMSGSEKEFAGGIMKGVFSFLTE